MNFSLFLFHFLHSVHFICRKGSLLEIKRSFDQFTFAQVSTEFDCRRISVIVHRSASDKVAVVHSSCLFGAESYFGQRERKSVWQHFQSKICELVSGKLSKCLYIHSYKHLITSSALITIVFWSITFKTTAPRNVTDNT